MTARTATCDPELLRRSLADRLSEAEEEALSRHLSECTACQRELELLAGQQEDWSKISLALKTEAGSSIRHKLVTPSSQERVASVEDEDESAADFAVDFLEPSSSAEAIGRLGQIDILEVIGRGGMGVVLKGYEPELKRLVAVKVLAPHLSINGAARRRFAREAQAVAAILHPNVMPILTVHSNGKLPYLVMPFLACESLQQRIERQGPLETVDVLRIGMQTAKGLAAAHAQGIVHRDVKPANILLERGVDRVMLTDFGLARAIDDAQITRTGLIAGTPQYMSPEQIRGEALDARSDLFSLGSVLYTMATGRAPFRAESTYGVLRRITDDAPRSICDLNPQIPEWLSLLIGRLLAKPRDARFGSAEEVGRLLEQCLAHVQQPATVPLPDDLTPPVERQTVTPRVGHSIPRRRMAAIGTALALVPLAAFCVHATLPQNPSNPLRPDDPSATSSIPGEFPHSADSGQDDKLTNGSSPMPIAPRDVDTDWDSVPRTLDALFDEGQRFDDRVHRAWDFEPQTEPPESVAVPQDQDESLPEQEITP